MREPETESRWLAGAVMLMGAVVLATAIGVGARWARTPEVASPSGYWLAYLASEGDASLDLYLADASGGRVQRLTESASWELAAAWSPDGEMLAFTRAPAGGASDALATDAGLYLITWVRGTPREEMLMPANKAGLGGIAWSPDGGRVAMIGHPISGESDDLGGPAVTLVEIPSRRVQQIPLGTAPQASSDSLLANQLFWTADGSALVFSASRAPVSDAVEHAAVVPVRLDLASRTFYSLAANGQYAALSSQGVVAYMSIAPEEPRLWLVDAAAGEPRALSEPFADGWWCYGLAWSPDGSRLASVEGNGEHSLLVTRSADGSPLAEYVTPHGGRHVAILPAWSLDGRYASYTIVTDVGGDLPEGNVIVVDTADGTVTPWASRVGTFAGSAIWRPGER